VINPDDAMTVNGACVAMGWRKPMLTVVNTPDGLAASIGTGRPGIFKVTIRPVFSNVLTSWAEVPLRAANRSKLHPSKARAALN